MTQPEIVWESAHTWIERNTNKFMREFKSSRPRPRNKAMGFKEEERPQPPRTRRKDGA